MEWHCLPLLSIAIDDRYVKLIGEFCLTCCDIIFSLDFGNEPQQHHQTTVNKFVVVFLCC